jgi:succinate dehydrogenase / fumarate reductase cytochrome b subunit
MFAGTVFAAKAIEALVFVLTVGAGLFAMALLVWLFRLKKDQKGPAYKGGIGQWSWVAHRITGVGVLAFLFGHIVDTFAVGFGPELYNETVSLYKQWWFTPFEVMLVGAVIFHAFNGLRIILFDFWPSLALKQKTFAYVELVLFVVAFVPAAVIMMEPAIEKSPFF